MDEGTSEAYTDGRTREAPHSADVIVGVGAMLIAADPVMHWMVFARTPRGKRTDEEPDS